MDNKYLEQRIDKLEEEVKHLERRISGHDTTLAKIEVIIEGLSQKWSSLEQKIDRALQSGDDQENKNTQAWKEVTIEAIKTIAIVAGAILAAKFISGGGGTSTP